MPFKLPDRALVVLSAASRAAAIGIAASAVGAEFVIFHQYAVQRAAGGLGNMDENERRRSDRLRRKKLLEAAAPTLGPSDECTRNKVPERVSDQRPDREADADREC